MSGFSRAAKICWRHPRTRGAGRRLFCRWLAAELAERPQPREFRKEFDFDTEQSTAVRTWLAQPYTVLQACFARPRPAQDFPIDLQQSIARCGRAYKLKFQREQNRRRTWREHPQIAFLETVDTLQM